MEHFFDPILYKWAEQQGTARAFSVFGTEEVRIDVKGKVGLVEWKEGSGLEVPGIRIAGARRENLALSQVRMVGDDEVRAYGSLRSLVRQRRHRINGRGRIHDGVVSLWQENGIPERGDSGAGDCARFLGEGELMRGWVLLFVMLDLDGDFIQNC